MLKSLYSSNILRFPDAKETGGSSSETFRTVGESTETATGDEMGASSGSDAASAADENGGKSMLDTVKESLQSKGHDVDDKSEANDKSKTESSTAEDENAKELGSENEHDKKGEEQEQGEEQNEEQTDENEEQQTEEEKKKEKVIVPEDKLLSGKDPIPVDRFKEVVTQRNTVREQLKQAEPIINDWRALDSTCKQAGITPQQFQEMLQVQVDLNTNPGAALPKLKAIVAELEGFTGDKLPEDLQTQVDNGEMELKYAKEIAGYRAEKKFGSKKLEHDRRTFEQQQQTRLQQELNTSATAWETAKKNSDPDYKPKANANDPDGKWEFVKSQFIAMLNDVDAQGKFNNPVTSPAEMTALMDKAYANVDASFKRLTRRPVTRKVLRSDGFSNGANGNGNGKSIEDQPDLASAVRVGLRQMGHRF